MKSDKAVLLICFALVVMIWAVFGRTTGHQFVDLDDGVYVCANPDIAHGLSATGIKLAFTRIYASNWHPVTMLSYLSDYELYGLKPFGYHLTNVLLHMATSIALFLVLRSMTGSLWRSAFVAMLFAVHPLRVESVAWISERKDVLSGLFFVLSLGAYGRYAKRVARGGPGALAVFGQPWRRAAAGSYGMVVVFFLLGLMSKPMLVTLPFVLLLLDYWPLRRVLPDVPGRNGRKKKDVPGGRKLVLFLIAEKVPLLVISAVFCGITVLAQRDATDFAEQLFAGKLSVPWRLANAACAYFTYIRQMFVPFGLTVLYPHPGTNLPLREIAASIFLLAAVFGAVFIWRKRLPYLVSGWLWYLGMLVPVIGLMQVGRQAHADRYTYLPQIGLCILLVWLVADGSAGWRRRRQIIGTAMTVLLAALMAVARVQTAHWADRRALWEHAVRHTTANYVAENNLAWMLATDPDAALRDGPRAVQLAVEADRSSGGGNGLVLDTLAAAYAETGRYPEAVDAERRAIEAASRKGFSVAELQARLRLFENGRPYHESKKE